ncbi:unnamed protein product [Closterium sp. Naga37s-1]|nr:unnamed protein product [Closterium sp. Naga37s-1]
MRAWGHVRLTFAAAEPTTAETAARSIAPVAAAAEAPTSAVTTATAAAATRTAAAAAAAAATARGTSSLQSQLSPSASCDSPQPRFFRQLMAQGHSPEGVYLPVKQAIPEETEDANNGYALRDSLRHSRGGASDVEEGDGLTLHNEEGHASSLHRRADEDGQSRLLHGLPWAAPAGGRRRLLGLGDVQYPLDGYFLSKSGLYYVQVQLGWNRQPVNLQVDTGSDLLWTRCICPSCPPPHPETNHTQQQPAGGQQSPSAPSAALPSGPSPSTPSSPASPPTVDPPSSASLNHARNMATDARAAAAHVDAHAHAVAATDAGASSGADSEAGPGQGLVAGAQMALEVDGSQRPPSLQSQGQAQAQGEGKARRVIPAAEAGNAGNEEAYAVAVGAGGVGREEERWDEETGQLAVPRGSLMRGAAEGGSGDWPVPPESQAGQQQQRHSLAAVGDGGATESMRSAATLESSSSFEAPQKPSSSSTQPPFEAHAAATTLGSAPSPSPPLEAAAATPGAATAGAAGGMWSKVQELAGEQLVYWAGNSSSLGSGACTDAPCTALTQQYALEMPVGCQVGSVRTSRRCQYMLEYGDGSTTAGDLLFDSIALLSTSKKSANATIAFGCGVHQSGRLASPSSTASLSGVMGLGRGPLSVVTQLAAQGVLHESFSLCLEGRQRGGHLVLGRRRLPDTNSTVTAPLAPSDDLTVYRLPLLALYLARAPIPLPNGTTAITIAPPPHGVSAPASDTTLIGGDGVTDTVGDGSAGDSSGGDGGGGGDSNQGGGNGDGNGGTAGGSLPTGAVSGGAVIDSGSTFTALPAPIFTALSSAVSLLLPLVCLCCGALSSLLRRLKSLYPHLPTPSHNLLLEQAVNESMVWSGYFHCLRTKKRMSSAELVSSYPPLLLDFSANLLWTVPAYNYLFHKVRFLQLHLTRGGVLFFCALQMFFFTFWYVCMCVCLTMCVPYTCPYVP